MASVGEGGGAVGGDPERDGGGLRGAAAEQTAVEGLEDDERVGVQLGSASGHQ